MAAHAAPCKLLCAWALTLPRSVLVTDHQAHFANGLHPGVLAQQCCAVMPAQLGALRPGKSFAIDRQAAVKGFRGNIQDLSYKVVRSSGACAGTGKTLLARAVANRTDACFIRVIGSELVQKYVGEGARMVRELFQV